MERSKRLHRIGWLCFKLAWLPFVTLFIGMIGMPEGEYAWSELPILTRYSLIGMGILFGGAFACLIGAQVVRGLTSRRIRAQGRPADATVLEVTDTGTTINEQPVVRIRLEVQAMYGPSFQAETSQLVSRPQLAQIQPGAVVRVKYLPETQEVALAREDTPTASSR